MDAERPLTPEENAGNAILKKGVHEISFDRPRRVLTADELAEMKDLRPRFEKELRLPMDSRGATSRVYMFSVDGVLRGESMRGCLFAGECMLIQAASFEAAVRLAKDALHSTIDAAREWYEMNNSVIQRVEAGPVANDPLNAGLAVDVSGRNGRPAGDEPLRTDPKLKDMIAHIIGGQPWKH